MCHLLRRPGQDRTASLRLPADEPVRFSSRPQERKTRRSPFFLILAEFGRKDPHENAPGVVSRARFSAQRQHTPRGWQPEYPRRETATPRTAHRCRSTGSTRSSSTGTWRITNPAANLAAAGGREFYSLLTPCQVACDAKSQIRPRDHRVWLPNGLTPNDLFGENQGINKHLGPTHLPTRHSSIFLT